MAQTYFVRHNTNLIPNFTRMFLEISDDLRAMEKCRYRLNNCISSFVLGMGGRYIHYPEIRKTYRQLLSQDGVHLNNVGANIRLNNLHGALEQFLFNDWITTFPAVTV